MSEEEQRKLKAQKDELDAIMKAKLIKAGELVMEMKISNNIAMPGPIAPGGAGRGTIELQTNLFGIRMDEDLRIFKYDVFITTEVGKDKKKLIEFSKRGKSDYVVTERKKNCMYVFLAGMKEMSFYRDDMMFYYDGQSLMYTTEKLVFKDPTKPNETVILAGEKAHKELASFEYIYLAIKECDEGGQHECHLSDIRRVARDVVKHDRSAMQFVDVVTSMNALTQIEHRFTIFQNGKIFPNNPDVERIKTVPLKEGKVLIPGLNKSVKLIEGPRGRNNTSPALSIDSLRVAFHVKEKLIDKALGVHPDINKRALTNHELETFTAMVRGLGCMTVHMTKNRRVEIHGISRENSSKKVEVLLPGELNRVFSVAEYFMVKYKLPLKYPNAPLVISRERGQVNLYPMELLEVIPMQRVTIPQTTSIQSQVTTKECAVPPGARQNAILDQCKLHDFFNPEQPFLKAAGLGIIEQPLRVTARLLKGPILKYQKGEMEVSQPNWRPPMNYQFAVPAKCRKWGLYAVITPRDQFGEPDLRKFAEAFVKRCRERGMQIEMPGEVQVLPQPPIVAGQQKSPDWPAREKIKECSYHQCDLLFFITADSISIHKHLKLQERYSHTVTQDLKLKTAQNFLQKNQMLTLDNIIYKSNLKLGGKNYNYSVKNSCPPNYNAYPNHRLVIGIGLSHAPQANLLDKNGVVLPAPAVVGYAANMGDHGVTNFIGDFYYQDSKKDDLLLCITEMMTNVIARFIGSVDDKGKRGPAKRELPKEVLVYRQGVAEGLYGVCLREEIPLMKAVLAANGAKDVKLTYIIVHKEHNIRLMPVDINVTEKPTIQNITSGIVVDSQMTHPRYREFFLNSHITLQGTARTPRYTVLYDGMNMKMDELEVITYSYCYGFEIVNSPISIPAPLYIANRYAERGVALYLAKATDEMATTEQKKRVSMDLLNEDHTFGHTPLGGLRINA